DAASRVFTGFRNTSESLSGAISDTISKLLGKNIAEAPPISDALSRVFNGARALAESPTISDIVFNGNTIIRGLTENLSSTIADMISRGGDHTASIAESLSLSDSLTRLFGGFRTVAESPTVSDSVSRAFTGFRGLSESLVSALSDSVSKGAGKFSSESLVPSDVIGRVFTGFRTLSEAPTLSDVASRVFTGFRSMSESLAGMTDSISKSAGKFLSE